MDFIGLEHGGERDIKDTDWEFPSLEKELLEGVLSHGPFPIYMFLGAQRISCLEYCSNCTSCLPKRNIRPCSSYLQCSLYCGNSLRETSIQQVCSCILIANQGRIAIASVELEGGEEIVDAKTLKMEWAPYLPKALRS